MPQPAHRLTRPIVHLLMGAGLVAALAMQPAAADPRAAALCNAIQAHDPAAAARVLAAGPGPWLEPEADRCIPAREALRAAQRVGNPGGLAIVQNLLAGGLDPNSCYTLPRRPGPPSRRDFCLVEDAAHSGNPAVVAALIERGLNARQVSGARALIVAAAAGNLPIVQLLTQAGASVQHVENDRTALSAAVDRTQEDPAAAAVVDWLDARGALEFDPADKLTAAERRLFTAARRGDMAVLRSALDAGAKATVVDARGTSALLRAVAFDQAAAIGVLLRAGASAKVKNEPGLRSPLERAVKGGHARAVSALLAGGAPVEAPLSDGLPPLHSALTQRDLAVARALLVNGARVELPASASDTSLRLATNGCEAPHFDLDLLRLLLASGADPRVKGRDGLTPLQAVEARIRSNADRPFDKACYEARAAVLRAAGPR